jgi:hypothetical protein
MIPEWMINLRAFYVLQYRDQNFLNPSPAFSLFIWLEGLYHLPLSIWAIFALWQNNPKVPIHLLIFTVEVAVSTGACIADAISWTNVSMDEKLQLGTLYIPYLAFASLMGFDMYKRLSSAVTVSKRAPGAKKHQ